MQSFMSFVLELAADHRNNQMMSLIFKLNDVDFSLDIRYIKAFWLESVPPLGSLTWAGKAIV